MGQGLDGKLLHLGHLPIVIGVLPLHHHAAFV
jgi:hypothetical protein